MGSPLQKLFLAPRIPSNAAGFIDTDFVVVDLKRAGSSMTLAASAFTEIPEGLVTPSLDSQNIHDADQLANLIIQTAEAAGLRDKKRWSVTLPEGAARTVLINLDSKPSSSRELDEMIAWKLDRSFGMSTSSSRLSRKKLSPIKGQQRYLVAACPEAVISEYENLFRSIGWQVGLILAKHLGEAEWLLSDKTPGDKMLVSANLTGFTSIITRKGEPVLVRVEECEQDSIPDELYRIALFYKDRIADQNPEAKTITRVLVIGGIDRAQVIHSVTEALGEAPELIESRQLGLDLTGDGVSFDQLAAAAGLAAIALHG